MTPTTIYRIMTDAVWQRVRADGVFMGSEHDLRDGFIHLSTAPQVPETAARHYSRQPDLLLIGVSVAALGEALRWEPSRGGALFPHLYGSLAIDAITSTAPLPLDDAGFHVIPALE